VHDVEFVEDHESVALPAEAILLGIAEIVTVGAGGGGGKALHTPEIS
jgi:hypothetical protein